MVKRAFGLSEEYEIPVMVRPATWVCHSRQGVKLGRIEGGKGVPTFVKDPQRWAATPRFRYLLHKELNRKIKEIATANNPQPIFTPVGAELAVIASGVPYAYAFDVIKVMDQEGRIALYKVDLPYPLGSEIDELVRIHPLTLILEEPYPVMEFQIRCREKVGGRLDLTVPSEGELTPDIVAKVIATTLGQEVKEIAEPPAGGRSRVYVLDALTGRPSGRSGKPFPKGSIPTT